MKKVTTLLFSFLLVGLTATAASTVEDDVNRRGYDGNSFIFTEGGVEFSIFTDGQFDFVYVGANQGSNVNVTINTPSVTASYNGGQDYEAFVQYDDYGAIIQIEDVAVFYDEFGRITQAGNVDIRYNNRRLVNVGGLFVHYNNFGRFSHHTGFINAFNPYYVYRPWHSFYSFPLFNSCVVYDFPYRRYYTPVRYSFFHHRNYYNNRYRVAYHNARRDFHRPGSRIHHRDGRVAINRDYNPRRTNTAIGNNYRRANTDVANARRGDRKSPAVNSRSNSRRSIATTKGRPAANSRPNTRPNVSSKVRPSVANTKGRPALKSRPSSSRPNVSSKGRPNVTSSKGRPAVKNRPVQRKAQAQSARTSRPVAKTPSRKSSRSVSRPSSSRKTVARNSGSRAKSSAPSRSSSSKSSSTKRSRGL